RPSLSLYYYSYHDHFVNLPTTLHLLPVDQAHLISLDCTVRCADIIYSQLKKAPIIPLCDVCGPYGLPCKPLFGMISPAILIEISIEQEIDWKLYVTPLATSIVTCFQQKKV